MKFERFFHFFRLFMYVKTVHACETDCVRLRTSCIAVVKKTFRYSDLIFEKRYKHKSEEIRRR